MKILSISRQKYLLFRNTLCSILLPCVSFSWKVLISDHFCRLVQSNEAKLGEIAGGLYPVGMVYFNVDMELYWVVTDVYTVFH